MTGGTERTITWVDYGLVFLVCLGIYLEVAVYLSPTVPIPSVLAGAAGLVLMWRRRDDFTARQLAAFMGVLLVLAVSCIAAPDWRYLPKRTTGLVQIAYSLVIAFALFLTLARAERRVIAGLFLAISLAILIGARLEEIPAVRAISDGARHVLYRSGIYESDLRDLIFYGKVRPKFFTSEPSAVTFAFSLFSLAWFLASDSRYRLLVFAGLVAASQLIIPGPTTLIGGVAGGLAYFLLPSRPGERKVNRPLLVVVAGLAIVALAIAASHLYAERIDSILTGRDPSFFYRVIGPALLALEVVVEHPLTGVGLTSEDFAADLAMNVFVQSPNYSSSWRFDKFSSVLTNYFWLHWIYLGPVFGVLMVAAVTLWLRSLGVAALAYCWIVWVLFGQASGAYVGPKTWIVMMLVAGLVHTMRRPVRATAPAPFAAAPVMSESGLVQLPYYRNRRHA
ncbi:MAG: hypothetical protein AB7R90_09900 [Reyranellaceae bacterium]